MQFSCVRRYNLSIRYNVFDTMKKDKIKNKRIEDFDFSRVFFEVETQFTLKKKNLKKEVPLLCKLILTRAREGDTLNMILYDLAIPNSKWISAFKSNKELQTAVSDASIYHKAYGEKMLLDMATGKRPHVPQTAKLLMSNFYDIREHKEINKDGDINSEELFEKLASRLPE